MFQKIVEIFNIVHLKKLFNNKNIGISFFFTLLKKIWNVKLFHFFHKMLKISKIHDFFCSRLEYFAQETTDFLSIKCHEDEKQVYIARC